jgi:hypothetical protein
MIIKYCDDKDVKCYRDFVLNPEDRATQRAFSKKFGKPLMEPAKKLHDRLNSYETAAAYNAVFGSTDNRIEIKRGGVKTNPLILKVRVAQAERKFFHQLLDDGNFLISSQWEGNFGAISTIYVFAINNHDYNI